MTTIGYARVSSEDQSTDIQRETLEKEGCARIFEERVSGAKADNRAELQACLKFLVKGDTLLVTKLDRLARSTIDMLTIVNKLAERGIGFKSLAEPWCDTTNAQGKFMLTVFAGVAEFERDRIKDRQREGIAKAKANGVYKGRKPKVTRDTIMSLKAQGMGPAAIAKQLQCSRATVYRHIDAS